MSFAEKQENVARSTMSGVLATLQHGGGGGSAKARKTACDTLHNFLDRTRFHNPAVDECFALLVKLSSEGDAPQIQYIKSAIQAQRNRVTQLSVSHMRDAVHVCLNAGQGIVQRALKRMDESQQQPPLEEQLLRVMTGATADERGKTVHLDPAFHDYMEIVKSVLQAMDKVAKFEPLIQETCRAAILLSAQHKRSYELGIFQALLKTHLREVFDTSSSAPAHTIAQREGVINNAETLSSIIQTKEVQSAVAREMRDWAGAVGVMRELRGLVVTLGKLERPLKVADLCPVWELEAEVLFAAGNAPFHAFQSVTVAHQRIFKLGIDDASAKLLASQAVLAVLCVPDKQLSSSDTGGDRLLHLAKMLGMMAPPSREALLGDLERQTQTAAGGVATLLSFALPCVRELYSLFCSTPTIEICQLAAPLLKQLSSVGGAASSAVSNVKLARYTSALEGVAIRNMLGIMSRCFSSVGIDDFIRRCGGILSASDVGARIEPLVREKFGQGVQIIVDFGSRRIFFQPSAIAADNLISFQSSLAAHIADVTRACYPVVAGAKPAEAAAAPKKGAATTTTTAAGAKSILSRIEDSRTRTLSRYVVCKSRIDNFAARLQALDEADRKRRAEDLLLRAEKEGAKVQVNRKKAEDTMQKIIAEEEAIERRKWVITQVNSRHKGLNLAATLATTLAASDADGKVSSSSAAAAGKKIDDAEFLNAASSKLLSHLRATEASRSSDVKTMEHWERACREAEIPLRKALFEEQSAKQAETAKLQAENRRKQHERAFQESLAMKQKLQRLAAQAESYEREVRAAFQAQQRKANAAANKQDDDLDSFMREREAAAAKK